MSKKDRREIEQLKAQLAALVGEGVHLTREEALGLWADLDLEGLSAPAASAWEKLRLHKLKVDGEAGGEG